MHKQSSDSGESESDQEIELFRGKSEAMTIEGLVASHMHHWSVQEVRLPIGRNDQEGEHLTGCVYGLSAVQVGLWVRSQGLNHPLSPSPSQALPWDLAGERLEQTLIDGASANAAHAPLASPCA